MADALTASFIKRFPDGPLIQIEALRLGSEREPVTVLFGESGCGKTTVLRCLAGLEKPDEGKIAFNGQTWFDAAQNRSLPPQARHIGFVPQDYALFPHLSVVRNIAYGLHDVPKRDRDVRVHKMVEWLGLKGFEDRVPRELSGGQQQRVALARAVVRRPSLLLLDEPLSALDAPGRQRVRVELRRLLGELRTPTLLVTHDRFEAMALGDRLILMHQGRLVQQGPVHEVFSRPENLAAAGILAVETVQPGKVINAAGGLMTVEIGAVQLTALHQNASPVTGDVFVCIRAEDVILTKDTLAQSSPRNRLKAAVRALTPEGPMVRVDLDCGFPLAAWLTKNGCAELDLHVQDHVLALIKVPQVHVIPHHMGDQGARTE